MQFQMTDTKFFCCYLVSLLAWGTSSGSTIPEDIRKQFLLCRTMSYFTFTADLIINYIRVFFFFFRTQRNIAIIRGGPGPWSGQRPGVSGISSPKWTIVQQQQCFLRTCKVMFAPKSSSRPGQPQGWHWKSASPAAGGIPGAAIPSPSPRYWGEPQIPRLSLRHCWKQNWEARESLSPLLQLQYIFKLNLLSCMPIFSLEPGIRAEW